LRVTDAHPDIKALNAQIDTLRRQLEKELAAAREEAMGDGVATATNPVYMEIQIALSNSNLKIAELDEELRQTRKKLGGLAEEVDRAPLLEGEFTRLTRDYDNYQKLYAEVLDSAERERIGRVGDEKDVINFNIINPPRAGFRPSSPNRPLLLSLVLLGSVLAGAAAGVGMFMLKPTIHLEKDLRDLVGYPVIGSVGMNFRSLGHSRGQAIRRFVSAAFVLFFVCGLVIFFEEDASAILRNTLEIAVKQAL